MTTYELLRGQDSCTIYCAKRPQKNSKGKKLMKNSVKESTFAFSLPIGQQLK